MIFPQPFLPSPLSFLYRAFTPHLLIPNPFLMAPLILLPWAVHLSDGVLAWPWIVFGFVAAGWLAWRAASHLSEDDVPRVAIMAAAFFVASSIHVKVGPSSVHLLLTGLVGVVLGPRAPLAIFVGIAFQALLVAHGGFTAIGINAAIQSLPALLCGAVFPLLRDFRSASGRRLLITLAAFLLGMFTAAAISLLLATPWSEVLHGRGITLPSVEFLFHPGSLGLVAAFVIASWWLTPSPHFAAGAVVGAIGVIGTLALTGIVLLIDGAEKWGVFVSAAFLAHVPLAILESIILGVVVQFLARVKPQMIGLRKTEPDT